MNKILIIKSLFIAFIAINIAGCKGNKANLEAEMYNIMGMNALQEGNYEQAADYFKKGKNSGINDHYCYILNRNIAQCYMNIQQTDSAKKYAFLSTKCCKKNSYDYLVSMADIDLLDNKIEAAKDKLTYAVAIKSQDMIAYNMLGLIYLGDYGLEFQNIENAVMYNRKAYELNRDRITEEVLARSYVLAQDYKNAEKHLRKLQSKHPNIVYYSFELGVVKYYLGQRDQAKKFFDKAIALDSTYNYEVQAFVNEQESHSI